MDHLRLDPRIDSDPAIEAAGWWAARVFELLLKVSALHDLRGVLRPSHQGYAWLAKRWNLTPADLNDRSPEDLIASGVQRLTEVGLLTVDGDAWIIRSWDKFYASKKTGPERTRAWRERRHGDARDVAASQPSHGDGARHGDATPHTPPTHSTPPTKERSAPPQKKVAHGGSENTPPGQVSKTPYSAATERPSAVQTRTPLDAVKAAWARVHGKPPVGWGMREERDLGPLVGLPVEEIEAVSEVAFRARGFKVDGRPEIRTVPELVRHWDRFAADFAEAITNTAPGRPLCVACGRGDTADFQGHTLCYPCGSTAQFEDGVRTVTDMALWVQARKESAA